MATSTDGRTLAKHPSNPVLILTISQMVSSHEEGIRSGYVRYVPELGKFIGFFGAEDPAGPQTVDHMEMGATFQVM